MHGKRILLFALAMSTMLFAHGCAQKPWDDGVTAFDPETLTTEKMLEDYDFIWKMLEENCPLLEPFARSESIQLSEMKNEFRAKIEVLNDGDAAGFVEAIQYLSTSFKSVGHISYIPANQYFRVMNGGSYESKSQEQLYHEAAPVAFYKWESTTPMQKSMIEKNNVSTANPSTDSSVEDNILISQENSVPTIKIKTFKFPVNSMDSAIDKISNFCNENISSKNIIVDVRGNGGGDTKIWTKGFAPLFAGKDMSVTYFAGYKDTEDNRKMWDDFPNKSSVVRPIAEIKNEGELDTDNIVSSELECLSTYVVQEKERDYTGDKNTGGKQFEGEIYVLADEKCFSATEDFVFTLKNSGIASIVGTKTSGGGMLVAQPIKIPFVLPNCGMIFQYEPFYCFNQDGSCNAISGTPPDIEISDGADALEVCLAEIGK